MDLKKQIAIITKEYYPEINIDRLSNCCNAAIYPGSDICSDCNEHCSTDRVCPTCKGEKTLEIRASYHPPTAINERWITITCPDCEGRGYKEK